MSVTAATGATRGSNLGGGAFSAILKEYYRPSVRDLLNSKTVLNRLLQRKTDVIEGKYAVLDLNTGRNFGYGAIGEGGRLPDPLMQQVQQARYSVRYTYGRIKFTGPSASGSRSDKGSFIRIMDLEVQGMTRDIQVNDNRILYGDGSGRLCQIAGGPTTFTCTNPGGITSTAPGTQFLYPGMRVGMMSLGTADTASAGVLSTAPGAVFTGGLRAAYIATVDRTAGTCTFSSTWPTITPLTTTAAITVGPQYLYLVSDVATDTPADSWSRGREPNGLAALVSDVDPVFQDGLTGNWPNGLGEIDSDTTEVWRSGVIENGGTPIPFAPDMMREASDLADITGDGTLNLFLCRHGIRRQYLNSLVANKRFPNTMEMDGGFKAITYDGRPIIVDKDCTPGRMYGLDLETLALCYETDYDWIDQDGSVLHRMQDYDAFQAAMYRYWQATTDARNRNVVIQDIIDT